LEQVRGDFEDRTWQAFCQTVLDGRSPASLTTELGMTAPAIRQAKAHVLRRVKEEVGDLLAYTSFFRVTRRAIPQLGKVCSLVACCGAEWPGGARDEWVGDEELRGSFFPGFGGSARPSGHREVLCHDTG
jgi:hypothetical protein